MPASGSSRSSTTPATSFRSIAEAAPIAQGTTPVAINWDYNLLAQRDGMNGNPPMDIVVPSDGVVAGVYIQAISAYAPHPNAAKLWMEYLYSDEGQLGWLAGYCHPIRFNALPAAGLVPAEDLLEKLPDAANYAKALFPRSRSRMRPRKSSPPSGMKLSAPMSRADRPTLTNAMARLAGEIRAGCRSDRRSRARLAGSVVRRAPFVSLP